MEPNRLEQFAHVLASADLSAFRMPANTAVNPASLMSIENGVARIPIKGVILASVPGWMAWLGIEATSIKDAQDMISAAIENDAVKSIELEVDSPGGTISGVQELANDVAAARTLKPLTAKVSGQCASAAYWVAAQAESIEAGVSSVVGSIGVFTVIADTSRAAENAGVKIHAVSSSHLKAAGAPGSPVSPEQIEDRQRFVDSVAAMFFASVASGRGPRVDVGAVATGQVWIGEQAKALGLVDSIRGSNVSATQAAPEQTAPLRAEETTMSEKEMQAEIELLKAKNATLEANQKAVEMTAKTALLDKFSDRFAPADRPAFEKVAALMGHDQLEAHLSSLTKVTRPAPVVDVNATAPATETKPSPTSLQERSAKILGTTVQSLAFFSTVESRFADGSAQMKDGRRLTRAEFDKLIPAA